MTIKNIDPNPKTSVTNDTSNPLRTQETLDTIIGIVVPGTEFGVDTNWFTTSRTFDPQLGPARAAECIIIFMFTGNDAKISFTFDGTRYGELFEGVTLKAGAVYAIPFNVEEDTVFNIRANAVVTIDRCVIAIKGKQAPAS